MRHATVHQGGCPHSTQHTKLRLPSVSSDWWTNNYGSEPGSQYEHMPRRDGICEIYYSDGAFATVDAIWKDQHVWRMCDCLGCECDQSYQGCYEYVMGGGGGGV